VSSQFRNLAFEGGGVRGIAYVGAMQVLSQRDILKVVIRVGGTSAGAINALIFALGYDIQEQRDILKSTDFRKFMDDSFGVNRDIRRLTKSYGYYKGDLFSGWIGSLIKQRLGNEKATFKDLQDAKHPELHVIGTNLSTGYAETFSVERNPNMPLVAAVRISMSIPLFFAAVRSGARHDVFVDGGVMLNYPVKLFDRLRYVDPADQAAAARYVEYYNRENAAFLLEQPDRSPYVFNCQTLGMRLDTAEEIGLFRYNEPPQGKPIKDFTQYARALIAAFMQVQENQHLHSDDWQRTLYINTLDVGTTDFDLSDEAKAALMQEGIKCAETYFQWFENSAESPVNRLLKPTWVWFPLSQSGRGEFLRGDADVHEVLLLWIFGRVVLLEFVGEAGGGVAALGNPFAVEMAPGRAELVGRNRESADGMGAGGERQDLDAGRGCGVGGGRDAEPEALLIRRRGGGIVRIDAGDQGLGGEIPKPGGNRPVEQLLEQDVVDAGVVLEVADLFDVRHAASG